MMQKVSDNCIAAVDKVCLHTPQGVKDNFTKRNITGVAVLLLAGLAFKNQTKIRSGMNTALTKAKQLPMPTKQGFLDAGNSVVSFTKAHAKALGAVAGAGAAAVAFAKWGAKAPELSEFEKAVEAVEAEEVAAAATAAANTTGGGGGAVAATPTPLESFAAAKIPESKADIIALTVQVRAQNAEGTEGLSQENKTILLVNLEAAYPDAK